MASATVKSQGVIAAITGALCFITGVVTMQWIAPDIYQFPEGRLRVIEQYGWLLHLWHFIVFPLVGLSVFFLNRALIVQTTRPFGKFATVCTIACCIALSHDIAIFIIETMSNEMFIKQQSANHAEQVELTMFIYTILNKLRVSTEWGIDVWLCLINLFMLLQGRFHPAVQVLGIATGVTGVLVLVNPAFHHWQMTYLAAMILWFVVVAVWLAKEKNDTLMPVQSADDQVCP
ncbi:hypothetical protein [Alteromonas lipolytica]|uniref:DUF4386 domain-containing protein n=1 Tax=Alteromonas lipolytica TaxID=1856405 RepID=A0A1E8F912_9ALTE|nr:hypothetical protein [Alteromonas lipolytica]OFI32404.1 hypothetical protein BFC17_06725 [Alteromonas lipolytica]GGF79958.1 hypothetical protein GCM10011338_35390 [Alteromonas lipolytica]